MTRAFRSMVAVAALFLVAAGVEIEGVPLPDHLSYGGQQLTLNGYGVRRKVFVKVYVMGLYLAQHAVSGEAVTGPDQPRVVEMLLLRDVDRGTMQEAVRDGMRKNLSPEQMAALAPRLDKFLMAIPDLKHGDGLVISYAPGRGTTISGHAEQITIPGKDFADALFSVWVGHHPVDDNLKKELLGSR
jgi:hypothetical protein